MNLNKILICGAYLLSGCSNNSTKTDLMDSIVQNSNNFQKQNYDNILQSAIEIDSIKIDGIPAFYRNKNDLIKNLGNLIPSLIILMKSIVLTYMKKFIGVKALTWHFLLIKLI